MKHCFLIVLGWLVCSTACLRAAEIWLSPDGNDRNQGSVSQPKATLTAALRQARELRRLNDPSVKDGIHIRMRGGTYPLTEPLLIRPEDSGTSESPTVIEAVTGEKPVLSGGVLVSDWTKPFVRIPGMTMNCFDVVLVSEHLNLSNLSNFRQLWINGKKRHPASDLRDGKQQRILAVNSKEASIRIPALSCNQFQKPDEIELMIHQMWEIAILRIKSIDQKNDSISLFFHQPESRIEFEHPWPPPVVSKGGNSIFFLSRAIEFLDEPGEWYFDRTEKKLYYLPVEGEVINLLERRSFNQTEAVIPVLETLVIVAGSADRPVTHIYWKGITFSYTGWTRPGTHGYVPLQAGMYLLDAYKLAVPGTPDKATLENQAWIGRQPAAVQLSHVRNTSFESCTFEHCGASGLDYIQGASGDRVEGCRFNDIAGSALVLGRFSDPGVETHVPYNPTDERELCQQMLIRNNLITDVANEYWGCVGILAGYVRNVTIEHNELSELSYSGISVGWGWTKTVNCMKNNSIRANLVHHFGKHNYSCGGLYTLSAQPGTIITENCVRDIYKPDYVHDDTGFYIYLDEASSFMTVTDNWCPEARFGMNSASAFPAARDGVSEQNTGFLFGIGDSSRLAAKSFNQTNKTVFENNGPQVSRQIVEKAGLEEPWKSILKSR